MTAMMVYAAESHFRMMADHNPTVAQKMRSIRTAAAYLWGVRVLVEDGQCAAGEVVF